MFGRVVSYGTPGYTAGSKLVDEGGQGSSNDNWGRTVEVPFDVDYVLTRTTQQTLPYGAVSSRTFFSESARRLLGLGVATGGILLWKKSAVAGVLLLTVGGAMVLYPGGA